MLMLELSVYCSQCLFYNRQLIIIVMPQILFGGKITQSNPARDKARALRISNTRTERFATYTRSVIGTAFRSSIGLYRVIDNDNKPGSTNTIEGL